MPPFDIDIADAPFEKYPAMKQLDDVLGQFELDTSRLGAAWVQVFRASLRRLLETTETPRADLCVFVDYSSLPLARVTLRTRASGIRYATEHFHTPALLALVSTLLSDDDDRAIRTIMHDNLDG